MGAVVFRKPKKGSAGGPSGWSQEAYGMAATYCVSNDSVGDSYLYRFVAAVAAGKVPAVIFPFIAGWCGSRPGGSEHPFWV